jgi:hypothetical protein
MAACMVRQPDQRAVEKPETELRGLPDRTALDRTPASQLLSAEVDEDGSPIPLRRHYPAKPRRTRPFRFLRT